MRAEDVTAAEDAAHRYALNLGEGQIAIETVIGGDILVIGLVALRRLDAKFAGRIVADGDRGAIIDPPLIENLAGVAVLVINLVEIEICRIVCNIVPQIDGEHPRLIPGTKSED